MLLTPEAAILLAWNWFLSKEVIVCGEKNGLVVGRVGGVGRANVGNDSEVLGIFRGST